MKKIVSVLLGLALLAVMAPSAMGVVGWCGNVWPVNGATYTSNDNIEAYVQIWKDGVTPPAGQGDSLAAYLYYKCDTDPDFIEVEMIYWGDVANNDEYQGIIPSGHGCSVVEFYVKVVDLTDMTECYGQDQMGNDPNFFINITEVTAQDVEVTFHLCLTAGVETIGDVCVTGGHDALTNWGDGVPMIFSCESVSPKLYQIDVTFPMGSNPYVPYKYKKDDCQAWESTPDHSFFIDDSSSTQDLPEDGWEYMTPDCPPCVSPVEQVGWGMIKALYR